MDKERIKKKIITEHAVAVEEIDTAMSLWDIFLELGYDEAQIELIEFENNIDLKEF